MNSNLECQSYTVKDIITILGIGNTAAYNLMNDSKFPAYKIGKKFYIRIVDFNKWFDNVQRKKFCA